MQIKNIVSEGCVEMTKPGYTVRRALGIVALGLAFSMSYAPSSAWAETEQSMDHSKMEMDHSNMDMDHSKMQMDHSHHTAGKSGAYKSSVVSYVVPNVKLMDMNRTETSLLELLGSDSPVILNFIYTTCTTICPLMSATFEQVQGQLGSERAKVQMVSISIDPENDTPEKLKEYAGRFEMGPRWKMLTGTLQDSIAVQRAFGVYAGEKMNQTPVTFLKAQGEENTWLRLDGLAKASDIIKELDQLSHGHSLK